MLSFIPLSAVAMAVAAAFFLRGYRKKRGCEVPDTFLYLTVILPFAAGGFHTYVSAVTTVCLVFHLLSVAKKQGYLRLTLNGNSAAVILVVLGYCLTPLWAADRGMALFGIPRYLPVLLYCVALMQLTPEQKENCLSLIPISGGAMTVLSSLLLLIPGTDPYLTVQGRLAGFLQYPNTYAAFLLAGLVLQYTRAGRKKWDLLLDGILILGVILSGSKTGFVLLLVTAAGIAIVHKKRKLVLSLAGIIGGGLLLAVILSNSEILRHANRFADIKITSGSFLVRLLYFQDALPMILKNPFGYGYMGYRALQGTFQTGRYYVTYMHNGFLQLLFEIGWVPALAMAAAFLRTMLSGKTASGNRLLMFVVLAHCMLDFDLQFFVFWVILLACLDFEHGTQWKLRKVGLLGKTVGCVCIGVCLWLASADFCYQLGKPELSLKLAPFHTDSLSVQLQKSTDREERKDLAEKIRKLNPTLSLIYSAKANAALSEGDVVAMMEYKEQAIRCARYTAEEYGDYFEKLYAIRQIYLRSGDAQSAGYCEEKMHYLLQLAASVQNATSPLATEIGQDAVLELPERYRIYMEILTEKQDYRSLAG